MTTKTKPCVALVLLVLTALNVQLSTARAQGTAFTYQGRLNDGGASANGNYDLRFTVYDSPSAGLVVGGPLTNSPATVSNGLFTVTLDPGVGVFTGPARWLEIGVRTNGSVAAYTTLSPRQALTASPYAITAGNVTGPINGVLIVSGTIAGSQLAAGAAAANLGTSGQTGVASGGVILSTNSNSTDLLNAGYVKIGQAELGELWSQQGLTSAPDARYSHSAVWTGTEMLVWGGALNGNSFYNTGGHYNPATDTWTPMAQDFHAAFGLNGGDDKHISVIDEGGVALAAIQGLNQKLEQKLEQQETEITKLNQVVAELNRPDAENARLQTTVAALQSQLEGLQKAVARLADKSAGGLALNSPRQEEP